MDILHVAKTQPNASLFTARFRRELEQVGRLRLVPEGDRMGPAAIAALMRDCDVLLTGWGSVPIPIELAGDPGRLGYICHLTGTVAGILPLEIIRSALKVTNWGEAPAYPVAEGALALLLACLKQLPEHWSGKREGEGALRREWVGSLRDLRLGLYGYGAIGRAFHALCRAFGARILVYDPFVTDLPADAGRAESLEELFRQSDAVAIHAALTPQTQASVTTPLLDLLPAGGIIINTARGEIIDQEALFAQLAVGRLRAGLDVLTGNDRLPAGHPAFGWTNLILTSHQVYLTNWPSDPERLAPWHEVALDNLRRHAAHQPLRYILTEEQLARST